VSGEHTPMMLWIEGIVALVIMLAFLIHSFFAFKPEHVEHHPGRVRVGAAIQGLAIGLLIGFVIVPLRMRVMEATGVAEAPDSSLFAFLPAVIMMIVIRRGALLKAPALSTYLRAYRRASLLKQRDDADKALAKLDVIEGRKAAA
jgi:hypothetical protein